MPWNEPAPDFGTAVQAEPKVPVALASVLSEAEADGEEDSEGVEADEEEEPLEESSEPQAAMPIDMVSARAARPVRRRVLLFMVSPFVDVCTGCSVPGSRRIGQFGKKFS
jgi:hypothetical protein